MLLIIFGAVKGAILAILVFRWLLDGIDDDVQLLIIAGLGAFIGATWQYWLNVLLSIFVIIGVLGAIIFAFLMMEKMKEVLKL